MLKGDSRRPGMNKNLAPLLAIAFVVAIICTAVFYGLVAGKLDTGVQASVTAVIATHDIPRGSAIKPLDVKSIPWTGVELPAGAFSITSQVEGQTAIQDIPANEPITDTRVASAKTGGGLGIPSGMRAISVQVSDSAGILSMMKPGHRVDVQAVYGANHEAELRTVLQNIEVLKVNPIPEAYPGKPALPVVTLLTTPGEADIVGLADAITRVRLVLRNPLDQEKRDRSGVGMSNVLRASSNSGNSPSRPRPVAVNTTPSAPAAKLSLTPEGAGCVTPAQGASK